MTEKEHEALFPQLSVTVQVTIVTPSLKVMLFNVDVPFAVVAPDNAKEKEGVPQLSVATASQEVPVLM